MTSDEIILMWQQEDIAIKEAFAMVNKLQGLKINRLGISLK